MENKIENELQKWIDVLGVVKRDHEMELKNGFGGDIEIKKQCGIWIGRLKRMKKSIIHTDKDKWLLTQEAKQFFHERCLGV